MWEYKTVKIPKYIEPMEEYINFLAANEWELFSVINAFDDSVPGSICPDGYIAIFKRLKNTPDAIQP